MTVAEAHSLGRKFGWGQKKLDFIDRMRRKLVVVAVERDAILQAYVDIDHFCETNGVGIGKNDIWIAATAVATDALLLTTDSDFDPLAGTQIRRVYFSNETGEIVEGPSLE